MFQAFKRWMGASQPVSVNPDPFGRERRTGEDAQRANTTASVIPALAVRREEIVDSKTRIAGYRFTTALSDSIDPPKVRMACDALLAEDLAGFAERRLAMVPIVAQNWFRADFRKLVAPHTVFMLDCPPQDAEGLSRWSEVCKSIRGAGARVALTGIEIGPDADPLFDNADMAIIEFASYSLSNFEMAMARLKRNHPGIEIVVDGLGSWPERRLCTARGADYCVGPFTTSTDTEQQPCEISQGRMALIEMLNLIRRDADLDEITETAKRHPEVALKIVAMANSPMQGLAKPVASIDQAVMILGRQELYRWLSVGMYRAGVDAPRDAILLELALARGRFLELVVRDRFSKLECEELFLVGLLSLLDSMLGMPMARVLERLRLSDAMRDVLLHSEGPLGQYLMLAIAMEKGREDAIVRLASKLALPEQGIASAWAEAFAWTDNAMRSGA
ncbi:MAG TPA: HDOD domain-containing protein [Burkholderiaceae bacterium]|jgi:EAL and modified HD-GYP domain-containing signal transduction protein